MCVLSLVLGAFGSVDKVGRGLIGSRKGCQCNTTCVQSCRASQIQGPPKYPKKPGPQTLHLEIKAFILGGLDIQVGLVDSCSAELEYQTDSGGRVS